MADGVEVRGNRVRVYFRYQGEVCREPVKGEATPANIANAHRLVGTINHEIQQGTFNYARHFPNSPKAIVQSVKTLLPVLFCSSLISSVRRTLAALP